MALKSMRLGRNKEKRGAARTVAFRHRDTGKPVEPILDDDTMSYIDVENDPSSGELVQDPDTIPRP